MWNIISFRVPHTFYLINSCWNIIKSNLLKCNKRNKPKHIIPPFSFQILGSIYTRRAHQDQKHLAHYFVVCRGIFNYIFSFNFRKYNAWFKSRIVREWQSKKFYKIPFDIHRVATHHLIWCHCRPTESTPIKIFSSVHTQHIS